MDNKRIGILGATSLVGECLLHQLSQDQWQITAFSRQQVHQNHPRITWQQLNDAHPKHDSVPNNITLWISAAPIWTLPEHFPLLLALNVRRIVVLSSTSRFSKADSSDPEEQIIAQQLASAESVIETWADTHGIDWIILRPTLIYGLGRDKNISEIARFILRFGFFPVFGTAAGRRQPIHARDVSTACIQALKALNLKNCAYNLSGGETLSYRDMVKRIFLALNKKPRLMTVPLWIFHLAISILRWMPRYRHWTATMAKRMNQDLVFESISAQQNLHFFPGPFTLSAEDLPSKRIN